MPNPQAAVGVVGTAGGRVPQAGEGSARQPVGRGSLTVFLGAAPGVGKTFAMLGEAQRRASSGDFVIVGLALTHGRTDTDAMLQLLERIPSRSVAYRGATFEELDVDAVLAGRPDVVVVDELAHRCVPGSRHEKRWEDVEELLDAGIDVITSLNVQHIDSSNDAVESATGVSVEETVPDCVVARADRAKFLDVTPEQLRARIALTDVLGADVKATALGGFYTSEHLGVLRSLGRVWLEEHGLSDERAPMSGHGPAGGQAQQVVVALSGASEAEHVLRRAAQIACYRS